MSDAQKMDALIRFKAAVWKIEMEKKADQRMEYGSAFYFDNGGNLIYTPLVDSLNSTANIDWGSVPKLPNGEIDYSRVVAIIHSHAAYNTEPNVNRVPGVTPIYVKYFSVSDPFYLRRPSFPQGPGLEGDWLPYATVVAKATNQFVSFGAAGVSPYLRIIIVGSDGSNYHINEYKSADSGYSSLAGNPGYGSDGFPGARGEVDSNILPPCRE